MPRKQCELKNRTGCSFLYSMILALAQKRQKPKTEANVCPIIIFFPEFNCESKLNINKKEQLAISSSKYDDKPFIQTSVLAKRVRVGPTLLKQNNRNDTGRISLRLNYFTSMRSYRIG